MYFLSQFLKLIHNKLAICYSAKNIYLIFFQNIN